MVIAVEYHHKAVDVEADVKSDTARHSRALESGQIYGPSQTSLVRELESTEKEGWSIGT